MRERLRGLIDEALWGPEPARRLVLVQSALSIVIGLRIALGPYRELARLPDALFDPVPALGFLSGMPSEGVIIGVQVLGAVAALAAVARRWPRVTYALAWLSYLVLAGLRGSRGKVLHNDLLLLWVAAVFLLAPVDVDARDRRATRRTGWPVRAAIVVTALVYFFAAYHKLRRSGPAWVFGDNMSYVMRWGPSVGEPALPELTEWVGESWLASRLSAGFILGVELVFPLAIWWRWLRPWLALAAVVLHVGTWLLLGLDYWAWALTVPIVLIDWPAAFDHARRRREAAVA